jgi:hypothetical protein
MGSSMKVAFCIIIRKEGYSCKAACVRIDNNRPDDFEPVRVCDLVWIGNCSLFLWHINSATLS